MTTTIASCDDRPQEIDQKGSGRIRMEVSGSVERMRVLIAFAVLSACGSAEPVREPAPPVPDPAPEPEPAVAEEEVDWVTQRCASEYAQIEANWATYMPPERATSPLRDCPRWRMADAESCGARVQPSAFNPCHCICDLCQRDEDCGAGASCVELPTQLCGGSPAHVCVRADDPCHPSRSATCATHCVALFGRPECVSRRDLRSCP